MGACDFRTVGKGRTPEAAFDAAVKRAQYDHGHAGYTGTIAEKQDFLCITVPDGKDPKAFADDLMMQDDPRVSDKWGPAGCVELGKETFLFFGWASS